MFRGRWKYLATILAAFASVCFSPAQGLAVDEDPYLYRTLLGTIFLEYEKSNYITDQYKLKNSHFTERYSLDTIGNLVSRRVFIYDASVVYTNINYDANGNETETDDTDYRIKTTILPNSAIPLTLHGARTESESSNAGGTNKGTNTNYGLEWRLLMNTLPKLQLTMDKTETESTNSKNNITATNLNIEKDLGPTTNEVFLRKNVSKSSSGDRSSYKQINATHGTKVSKSTSFSAGGSRSDSEDNRNGESSHDGYSFALNSAPSRDFQQNHSYFYYKTSDDGRRDGSTYSGNLTYNISKDLTTNASVAFNKTESSTATSQSKSSGNSSSGSVSYRLTRTVSISENVSYNNNQSSITDSIATNTSDYKTFTSTTSASYGDTFSWTSFGLSYGGSYVEEEVGEEKSTAIGQTGAISLGNINFNRYVGFNTSASFSESESPSGKTNTDTRVYDFGFFNKALVEYISISGGANKSSTSSWIEGMDQRAETYRLDASSNMFKIIAITGFAERLKTFDGVKGWTIVDTEGANVSQKSILFGGPLELSASYRLTEREYYGGTERLTTAMYLASYERPLLGLMAWKLDSSITEKREDRRISRTSTIKNSLVYPLRAWLFSLDHRYILNETTMQDSNENVYLFRASRSFARYL